MRADKLVLVPVSLPACLAVYPLQGIICNQVVEVNSKGMAACDLNDKLNCLEGIHQGKYNIMCASAEAAMDKRFTNLLKSQESLLMQIWHHVLLMKVT